MTIYRIKAGRKPDVNIDDFIGETGTIWYDETTAEMRIYNGQPGGTPFNLGGSGSNYHLPIASPFRLGGIKVGSGLAIDADGALSTIGGAANIGAFTFANSTISTSDSTNIFVDRVTTFNSDVTIDGNLTLHGTLKDQNGKPITGNSISVSMIDLSNAISGNVDNVTAIRFDTDSGFEVLDLGGGEVKIAMNSTFKYWQVDGQDTLIAVGLDTMKFDHGPSISITTNTGSNPKSIRFDTIQDIRTTAKPTFAGATLGAIKIEGSTIKTTDSSAIIINQIVNMNSDLIMSANIISANNNLNDIGSPNYRWANIYGKNLDVSSANLGAIHINGSTINTIDSSAITINQIVKINSDLIMSASIIPAHDNVHDLGSPERRWRNIYVGGDSIYIGNYGSSLSTDVNDQLVWGSKKVVTTNLPFNSLAYATTISPGLVTIGSNIDVTLDGVISVSSSPSFTSINIGDIIISGNTISSTVSNSNIVISPNGIGLIDVSNTRIINLANPINDQDAATKKYVDTGLSGKLSLTGGTMSGNISMGGNKITDLAAPTDRKDAVTKEYVDNVSGGSTPIRTFNILGTYPAPIPGTARFQPADDVTIKRVQLTNSQMATTNIVVGFYVDEQIVQIFTLNVGTYSNTVTGLNIFVRSSSYITVGILSGTIYNFSMGLFIS
jgi:hypothetical protein